VSSVADPLRHTSAMALQGLDAFEFQVLAGSASVASELPKLKEMIFTGGGLNGCTYCPNRVRTEGWRVGARTGSRPWMARGEAEPSVT
jgi:hypothetical protein